MLNHPTLDKLRALQLRGMAAGLEDQARTTDAASLTFEERLGLLLDREATVRADRRLTTRLTQARLRDKTAVLEDLDRTTGRTLDQHLLEHLRTCTWISQRQNLVITGPTGVGKTYLACALAHQACREGHRALYQRLPRLLHDLEIAKGDGRYPTLLTSLHRVSLLILDDWGVAPMTDTNRRDLLELLDDRYDAKSTLITSQIPTSAWHEYLADPTLADAILDRFMHNAHHLDLQGGSMRKARSPLTNPPTTSQR